MLQRLIIHTKKNNHIKMLIYYVVVMTAFTNGFILQVTLRNGFKIQLLYVNILHPIFSPYKFLQAPFCTTAYSFSR